MSKPKLTYFDIPASRGEECRIALHVAGVDFEDHRIKREEWVALKPNTPFGALPLYELPGHPVLAQSNAILTLVGRGHGLHPKDDFEAARHEAMMQSVEELRMLLGPSLRLTEETEKKKARELLVATVIPTWATFAEKLVGDGPFFAGATLHVVDIKLHILLRWFLSGILDHIPTTVLDPFPKLLRLNAAVADHAAVKAWRAKH